MGGSRKIWQIFMKWNDPQLLRHAHQLLLSHLLSMARVRAAKRPWGRTLASTSWPPLPRRPWRRGNVCKPGVVLASLSLVIASKSLRGCVRSVVSAGRSTKENFGRERRHKLSVGILEQWEQLSHLPHLLHLPPHPLLHELLAPNGCTQQHNALLLDPDRPASWKGGRALIRFLSPDCGLGVVSESGGQHKAPCWPFPHQDKLFFNTSLPGYPCWLISLRPDVRMYFINVV